MTKAELIDRIARSRDLPPDVTKKVIAKILDLGFAELATYFVRARVTRTSTPRFSFPKFGTFTKKKRSSRRGVNPRTLEPMDIEACETVDFKPSTELKRLLNESASPASKSGRKKKKPARATKKSSAKRKTKAKVKTKASTKPSAKPSPGPGRRKLVTRDEVELEPPIHAQALPDAPLQKASAKRRRRKLEPTGN